MSLILSGSDGLSDVDGSAATPAIRGTDSNTGIFFPAADTIAFAEGGAEVARFDSSGNLGIGTSSPTAIIHASKSTASDTYFRSTNSLVSSVFGTSAGGGTFVYNNGAYPLQFYTNDTERARIDSSGNLLIGKTDTSATVGGLILQKYEAAGETAGKIQVINRIGTGQYILEGINASGGIVGGVVTTSTATSFNTSSDYRLKEDVQPMTGALAKVAALKPVTYKWKSTGEASEGFIAHELAEVCPDAVSGEKDAVDADGNIKPQGIDTSFLVATLTAAIQELRAIVDSQAARIAALEGAAQ
jgi:hypothetical protein